MKTCICCNETKDLEAFSLSRRGTRQVNDYCRACGRKMACQRYRDNNKEKIAQSNKRSYHKNHDAILLKARESSLSLNGKYSSYKYMAKARHLSFDLTKEDFETFWQQPCSYCGRPIATIGIDRVDSSKGYHIGNCVSCCTICNVMKLDTPEDEWYSNMLMVLKYKGIIDQFSQLVEDNCLDG